MPQDKQEIPSVKKMAMQSRKAANQDEPACRSATTAIGPGDVCNHFFLRKKNFWNAAIASGERIRSPKK
jgi:hypothetical protein